MKEKELQLNKNSREMISLANNKPKHVRNTAKMVNIKQRMAINNNPK
jgi:hypothetical protein